MTKTNHDPATGIDERYDEIKQLLLVGKERGFLAYEEIIEVLPDEASASAEVIEEIFSLLETNGIELVDSDTKEQLVRPDGPPRPKGKNEAKL